MTSITLSTTALADIIADAIAKAQNAALVAETGSEVASQAPVVADPGTGATRTNAAGRLVYVDGPLKGKFAPMLTDAERAEKAEAGAQYVAERAERAAARKANLTGRKTSNSEMAAWLRDLGFVPNGTVWTLAKAGERSKSVLAKAAAVDAKARAAAKAAKA